MELLLKTLKENPDIIYLWELFENKCYSRQRYSEWLLLYPHNRELKDTTDAIKEILETRAVKWAMKGKLHATFTIFHLKNNFGWKDKTEVDQNIAWNMSIASILWDIQKEN